MWYSENTSIIKTPQSITVDGITHPSAVFKSKSQLQSLGIYPARVEAVDQRYLITGAESYNFTDGEWVISYATTDKPVDEVKARIIEDIKAYVHALLMPNDWRVIRASEVGNPLTGDWLTFRQGVREKGNALEAGVQAFASIEACRSWENHSCQEERKVSTYDADGNETITDDTEIVERVVNKSRWNYPAAPDAEADPQHVRWL